MKKTEIMFEILSRLGKKVRITKAYWNRIIQVKHPNMEGRELLVMKTLIEPSEIRQSKSDFSVYLYYRPEGKYYNAVVVKHLNGEAFIITTYITDRIKEGKQVWKKSK